jgi:hypothetical protein
MKQIDPVSIWYNGQVLQATTLNAYVISDNLEDTATFYYALFTQDEQNVSGGNLTISGQSYLDWNQSADINNAAYTWIADQLSLTII